MKVTEDRKMVTLRKDLWRGIRIYAAEQDLNMKDAVDVAVTKFLEWRGKRIKETNSKGGSL